MSLRDVRICRWRDDATSPVCLMVDDLANVWVKTKNGSDPRPGDDWGHYGTRRYSSLWWLENRVLKGFEQARVTFFVPIIRAPMITGHNFPCHFGSIAENEEVRGFFRTVHNSPRYELAYHGLSHGVSGTASKPFVQEWHSFASLEEAIESTNRGREIFREVIGKYPRGGKYCGYKKNEFSDESIDKCGFDWWCRYNNRGSVKEGAERPEHLAISSFGLKPVIDLPTTLYGHIMTPVPFDARGFRWCLFLLRKYLVRPFELRRQVSFLVKNGLPILIQEHSARSRTDGLPQTPNIVDDTLGLRLILRCLSYFKVWHATCSEIADYHALREAVNVKIVESGNAFVLDGVPENCGTEISVSLEIGSVAREKVSLLTPGGKALRQKPNRRIAVFTFIPNNGQYTLLAG